MSLPPTGRTAGSPRECLYVLPGRLTSLEREVDQVSEHVFSIAEGVASENQIRRSRLKLNQHVIETRVLYITENFPKNSVSNGGPGFLSCLHFRFRVKFPNLSYLAASKILR